MELPVYNNRMECLFPDSEFLFCVERVECITSYLASESGSRRTKLLDRRNVVRRKDTPHSDFAYAYDRPTIIIYTDRIPPVLGPFVFAVWVEFQTPR